MKMCPCHHLVLCVQFVKQLNSWKDSSKQAGFYIAAYFRHTVLIITRVQKIKPHKHGRSGHMLTEILSSGQMQGYQYNERLQKTGEEDILYVVLQISIIKLIKNSS